MADDNTVKSYRSNDALRRGGAASHDEPPSNDPLAELARLIGQRDPFADLDHDTQRRSDASRRDIPPVDPAPARSSYRTTPNHDFAPPVAPAASYQAGAYEEEYSDEDYSDRAHAGRHEAGPHDDERVRQDGGEAYHDARYAPLAPEEHDDNQYFFDDAGAAPLDERIYDDPPRARRQGGLVTALVLVGCAIFGTAAAYGYRSYYSAPRSSDAPIITADTAPSKLVPPSASGDSQSGKPIQDRLGGPGNERIVRRQEEPVALPDATGTSGSRVVLPAPFTTSPGPAPGQAGAPAEPKKIRTVTIRPDGSEPLPGAASASPATPPPVAARQPPATKPARSNGPLSLEPQAGEAPSAYQSPARDRVASIPPSAPKLASAPSTGAYVQLSSQKSEAEAQASFRSLQAKFPKVLGDRQPLVRRADLGPKGVYYRAMVGPFASAGEADRFCGDLKASGGQCLVQKN
jgi:hypothetical protein